MLLCMAGTGVGMANQKIEKGTKKMTTAYVGCRTTAKRYAHGKGISRYTIDEKGNWKLEGITKTLDNPAWLVLDQTKNIFIPSMGMPMKSVPSASKKMGTWNSWIRWTARGRTRCMAW